MMISVVVPVYNAELYLEKCVRSILNQNSDFELLLINDGSTDGSGVLCDRLAEEDARVRVFHQENAGVSVTRNRGIAEARGDYVMFVDSDDWIREDALEALEKAVQQNAADVIVFGIAYYKNGKCFLSSQLKESYNEADLKLPILDLMHSGVFASSVNKLYKRTLLNDNGFCPGVQYGEDMSFNMRILAGARSIQTVDAALYVYNKHENSLSTNLNTKKLEDMLRLYGETETFFLRIGLDEDACKQALSEHFFQYLYPYKIREIAVARCMTYREKIKGMKAICRGAYREYLFKHKKSVFCWLLYYRLYNSTLLYCKLLAKMKKR